MIGVELFDRARQRIAQSGFDCDTQTRIALFVGTAKTLNAALLAAAELMPRITAAFPFVHGQYFRETEFASLLARVTRWSANPLLYWQATALVAPLWREWLRIVAPFGTPVTPGAVYRGLAFGHALLARVRLTPAIPAGADELDPFVLALQRIEQENGRMLQAQIRLLKAAPIEIDPAARAIIVEEEQSIVDGVFERFLDWLAGSDARYPTLTLEPVSKKAIKASVT